MSDCNCPKVAGSGESAIPSPANKRLADWNAELRELVSCRSIELERSCSRSSISTPSLGRAARRRSAWMNQRDTNCHASASESSRTCSPDLSYRATDDEQHHRAALAPASSRSGSNTSSCLAVIRRSQRRANFAGTNNAFQLRRHTHPEPINLAPQLEMFRSPGHTVERGFVYRLCVPNIAPNPLISRVLLRFQVAEKDWWSQTESNRRPLQCH